MHEDAALEPEPRQMVKLTAGWALDFTFNISDKLCFLAQLILALTPG